MVFQFKVIIVLLQFGDRSPEWIPCAIGPAISFRQERFLFRRVKAVVSGLVKMTGRVESGQSRLHHCLVTRLGGANKVVYGKTQYFGQLLKKCRELVTIFLRLLICLKRGLLDFLAVFIDAGQEKHFVPQAALRPRNHVRHDFFISVAEVRLAIDVIDGCGDVKTLTHSSFHCGLAAKASQ